ncbi:hypothetical protein Aph02nite_78660 [Actinoplanes philippinensis]|nr:hypothetical protein Aph02nite_78660 [Actinoplanes philippinensis]
MRDAATATLGASADSVLRPCPVGERRFSVGRTDGLRIRALAGAADCGTPARVLFEPSAWTYTQVTPLSFTVAGALAVPLAVNPTATEAPAASDGE